MAADPKRLIVITVLLVMCGGLKPSAYRTYSNDVGRAAVGHAAAAGGLHPSTGARGALSEVEGQASGRHAAPKRIVSLVPALTEMLFAIGAGPLVVGVGSYDEFPPPVKALPKVGALLDPDMERMLALRPDLAVVYGSQTDLQTQLARAGIRTYNYRHAGMAGVFRTIEELGALLDRRADAARVVNGLRAQIAAVGDRVRGRPRPRTLLVFERDPTTLRGLYVSGGRGFLHDVLEAAGGTNVFADVDREAVQPSLETLLARAPDVILEVSATGLLAPGESPGANRQVWSSLAAVPAVRNRRIHSLTGQYLVVPGPRLGQAAEAFARALHPDAFR